MSLRELGVFEPLPNAHPWVAEAVSCARCARLLCGGLRTALTPGRAGQPGATFMRAMVDGRPQTVDAVPICATCHLRGQRVQTPLGVAVVARVVDGQFPVETSDGRAWADEEIGPVSEAPSGG